MFFVYIIQSQKDRRLYIGHATNISRRIEEHNNAVSRYTKPYVLWKLAYYEAYFSRHDAIKRERMLKTYKRTLGGLKRRLNSSLNLN